MIDDKAVVSVSMISNEDRNQRSGATEPDGDPTRDEVSNYITDMLQELRDLARASRLGSLTAVLEIAAVAALRHEARPVPPVRKVP